ncbi:MAG: S-methyl-5'-thioadenosine phosphorylase [Treponema sp.]|jgi:5'-methylthioadenosine phosphorylase|nr:S-methyl-5'-thioadenosine phosphorylase [Treponema sp.]
MAVIGIIGGSGLENPDILRHARDETRSTPYGDPSSALKCGKIGGTDVILLARHGRKHTIPPSQVNYRANIFALKSSGCTHILATSAAGSLKEEIRRGDFVIIDQFIDCTKQRKMTFHESFEPDSPVHCSMAEPYDGRLRRILADECRRLGYPFHEKGTVVTIEGPRFSTRAESNMFRLWGAAVINMSISTETALANEAGVPYAAVAMSTDYDCWKTGEEPVTWEAVLKVFSDNAARVTALLTEVVPKI